MVPRNSEAPKHSACIAQNDGEEADRLKKVQQNGCQTMSHCAATLTQMGTGTTIDALTAT